ncbi:glycoside hydrolase family 3 N-terminal domain-containing protein [uncultured Legionella sp.]|uniref:glycoside hydrolase family 3 protein n=1 Tax=uncultured Legionella sp. TaxID=210934 RepID=UPI0026293605|nr:glycoside hydrolase family 3 N-terminal domain-containing protein [uncultured Legionella sp.]
MRIYRIAFVFILSILFSCLYASEPTLRDKIGQMLIIGFHGKTINEHSSIASAIDKDNIGGVILFDYNQQSQTFDKNIESPTQLKNLTNELQLLNYKANQSHSREDLPLFISIDYEGGLVNRLHPRYGFPEIPSPKSVGMMSDIGAKGVAELMADTMTSVGINLDFFPSLDVDSNPENPIIGKKERSFSAIPLAVSYYANLFSNQFKTQQIQCSYKHFPGHGSSLADSHLGFVDVTDTWSTDELIPYLQAFSQPEHCNMVMIAHIVNRKLDVTGYPASLSYNIINGLLRHDLQFDGVVITDDLQMKAISNYFGVDTAVTLAINAGADMLIFGNQLVDKFQDPAELIDIIEHKVQTGEVSEQRINDAYQRIVTMKRSMSKKSGMHL